MSTPADLDPRRAAKASVVVGSGKLAAGLLSFAALVLVARLLEPADYGRLALVLVSSSVLYAVLASWSSLPVYVLAAEELRDQGTMAGTSAARSVLTGVLTGLVGLLSLLGAAVGLLDGIGPMLIFAWAVAGLGYTVCEHVTCLLETRGTYAGSVAVQVVRPLAWALGLLALVVTTTAALEAALWVLVTSWAMAAGLALALASRLPVRPLRTSRRQIAVLVRAATPLIAYSVSHLLFGSVDLYVLRLFATAHEVGVYGLAYQCFGLGALLSSTMVVVITPRLAGNADSPAAVHAYLVALERRGLPLLAAAIALLLPWVAPVTRVLFGDGYRDVGPPLVVLTLAFLALVATTALAPVLLVRRKFHLMARIAVTAVVLNTALDLVLVGAMGLGVTAPAAATSMSLALTWFLYRHQMYGGGLRPLFGLLRVAAAPAVVAVASLLLPVAVAAGIGAALAALQLLASRRNRGRGSAEGGAAGSTETSEQRS